MINLASIFLVLVTSASLSFSQPPTIIPVGEEVRVTINVSSGGKETLGTDAVILYDPKMLSATRILPGKLYPNYPPNLQDIDNVHGKVQFSGTVGLKKPLTAEGVLGEISFRAKKPGTTKIGFDFEPGGTADSNIVPSFAGLDLLEQKPKEITLSIRSVSSQEKIWFFLKRILSFDYLRF